MKEEILELKGEFERIKNMGLIKSMRKGSTGIGYTFETLLGKKEDQESKPDYKGIEIKCKLGYTKNDLSLFTCAPKRDNEYAINYIFSKYSYHLYGNENAYRLFSRKVFSDYKIELYNFSFALSVNYNKKQIIMESYKNDIFYEDVCYWNFSDIENKIITKLNTLAIIKGYPYRRNGEMYYKYFNINFYKLTNFEKFLQLVENGKIYVMIYLRESVNKSGDYIIDNHGFSFRIRNEYINKLFNRIKI